jgi:protein SCO1/2
MSKYKKAGILIALLMVPAFVFLFLKGFTTNHFDLPYFRPLTDSSGRFVLNNYADTVYKPVTGWHFTRNEAILSEKDLRGKWVVVGNMYANCSDSCKQVLTNLKRVETLTVSMPGLLLVTLTDSRKNVERSFKELELSENKSWWILEGSSDEMASALESLYIDDEKNTVNQTISASQELVLLDEMGFVRGRYDGLDPEEIDRLMAEIKILEYNSKSLKR